MLSSKKLSSVKAVAKISVSPKEHINTTTLVRFDSAQSIVEDGKLLEEEWKGKEDIYRKPGTHTVELRVKDKNDNWSEWATMDIEVAEKKGIKCLHAGGNSVFAVHFNGIVEAYGGNDYGQLGNSSNMPNKEFEPLVVASGCFDVATGGSHTLFIDLMRFVKSTGKNSIGQLGLGNRLDAKTFQKIWGLEKVKEVVCGENFSAALTYDGDVYTWGNNEYKQLGHSSKQKFVEMPKKVSGLARVKQIALGKSHTVCLLHDGTLVAWGENTFGQLGLGYKGRSNEMGICTVKNIAYVCASSGYTFAVTKNGRVQAFGINKRNQLGVVGEKEVLFPEEILQLKSIVKIVSCADFSVALDEIGQVYAWGQFDSLENDYPVKPEIIHGVKYAKDIAATSAHGYILTQDDKILEFGTDLGDLRVIRDSGEPKKEEA